LQMILQVGDSPVSCTVYEPYFACDRRPVAATATEKQISPMTPPLLAPIFPGLEQVDTKTSERERVPPQRVWRVVPSVERPRAPAWVIGSLVHEALASWRVPGRDSSGGSIRSFDHWCEARARSYGLADHLVLGDAVKRSLELLMRFRSHPLYEEMDGADRRLHEVPYSLEVDGKVENGIIDSLHLREGKWTIVEFKTDRVESHAALEQLLVREDYLAQAQRYLAATEHLLGQRPSLVLCMLNYAGTVYLRPVRPSKQHRISPGGE